MSRLTKMISEEGKAPGDYRKLLKEIKNKNDRKVIHGIIKQEKQHKKKLLRMK